MNNARVMLMRNDGKTRMWFAKVPGVFDGMPDFVWLRELSDNECKALLENPWRMFDKLEPDGRVMFCGQRTKLSGCEAVRLECSVRPERKNMDWIKEGDKVKVNFNGAQITLCHVATVLHVPQATGDSWVFKDYHTQEVHYVSEGCTITVLERA